MSLRERAKAAYERSQKRDPLSESDRREQMHAELEKTLKDALSNIVGPSTRLQFLRQVLVDQEILWVLTRVEDLAFAVSSSPVGHRGIYLLNVRQGDVYRALLSWQMLAPQPVTLEEVGRALENWESPPRSPWEQETGLNANIVSAVLD